MVDVVDARIMDLLQRHAYDCYPRGPASGLDQESLMDQQEYVIAYTWGVLPDLILASGSPRRKQWLEALRIPFTVVIPHIDETPLINEGAQALVERLAQAKAEHVSRDHVESWILAADTTVSLKGKILNKPRDPSDAIAMLKSLQGQTHEVHTGCCLRRADRSILIHDMAHVTFRAMSEEEIRWYVSTEEPMDKAGAYAIQGQGAYFITNVEGSYATVMGLPVEKLIPHLKSLGLLKVWARLPD